VARRTSPRQRDVELLAEFILARRAKAEGGRRKGSGPLRGSLILIPYPLSRFSFGAASAAPK
jgi:hypothetical protein